MANNKPELLNRNEFIDKIQRLCRHKQQPSSLAFIEINNAVQVARLLQGCWAEQKLINVVEDIIVDHVAGSGCLTICKENHHLFALVFNRPVEETVDIIELLADIVDRQELKISDTENKSNSKIYYPKLNIGITPLAPHYNRAEVAMTAAEEALYQARHVGNSIVRVVLPDNQGLHHLFDCLHSLPLLRAGLVEKSFVLYAQPIVPIASHQGVLKAEVLLRYKDQNGRIFPPWKFLQAAALFNVSREVDLYVVENFCRFMQQHPGETMYSLNISGSTVRYPQFFDFVKKQFKFFGVNPQRVCFEITENVADKDYEQASQLMFKLKNELGCQLSLDDIGIGSSNLGKPA